MTRSNPAVIPFPKRFEPLDCLAGPVCHFQAAAELRVAMLHKLFSVLARSEASASTARELHEQCQSAREPLNRPLKNYCARLCGVEVSLGMLMYYSYIPLPRLISPCLAVARYVFQRSVTDVVVLYRSSLAQAAGRAADE